MRDRKKRSRVFVVQRPGIRVRGEWRDKYDLAPAEHFGELVEVLPRGNVPSQLDTVWRRLWEVLEDYSDDDYILCLGDPVAIAMATIAAYDANGGVVNVLKWDRWRQEYGAYRLERPPFG